ncbi:hypothetical protein ACX5I6_20355 [Arthrobacter sp. MMS24-T111]
MITQEVLEGVVSKIFGSSTRSGTAKVCASDATIPAKAKTATNGRVLVLEGSRALRADMGKLLLWDDLKLNNGHPRRRQVATVADSIHGFNT